MTVETYTYLADLPDGINEMVCPCADGNYTIYLDARLDQAQRQRAYRHALRHIERNDFERENVDEVEAESHKEDMK